MIDQIVVDGLTKEWRSEVTVALATLQGSNILQMQMQALRERLVLGSDEEPVKELARKVLVLRQRINILAEFEELCTSAYKELNHG